MTVTDPRGDPSLLQTVVQAEHSRLGQLLAEARRDTSGTPGVHEHLVRRLRTTLAEHLQAEAAVVHPEVRAALGDEGSSALDRDVDTLRAELEREDLDLERFGQALQSHVETSDRLLADLRGALGGKQMAALGHAFGRVAEAAPGRADLGGIEDRGE